MTDEVVCPECGHHFAPDPLQGLRDVPTVVAEELAGHYGIERVWVHGSWAARMSGEPGHRPHDIDLIIIGCFDWRRDAAYWDALSRMQQRLGIDVGAVVWGSKAEWDLDQSGFARQVRTRPLIEVKLLERPDAV